MNDRERLKALGITSEAIRLVSEAELEKTDEKSPFVLLRDGAEIAKCSDFEMITPDGRRYGLFCSGGEPLLHFLQAQAILVTKKDRKRLAKVWGMIVEVGSKEPPQIYYNYDSLVRAWVSLHVLYGVPVPEEQRFLIDDCGEDYNKIFSDPLLNNGDEEGGTVR